MKWKRIATILLITLCLLIILMIGKAYIEGKFNSVETLQEYIKQYGIFGPIVLVVIQALQVVIPVLPGFLECGVGSVSFGWFIGFLSNYIGISLGSIIAFLFWAMLLPLFPDDFLCYFSGLTK